MSEARATPRRRQHREALFARREQGESITTAEVALATLADTTMDDLVELAERLTARSGIAHHIYEQGGGFAVYPATIGSAMDLERAR
jgi:hypothetical protein